MLLQENYLTEFELKGKTSYGGFTLKLNEKSSKFLQDILLGREEKILLPPPRCLFMFLKKKPLPE